MSGLPEHLLRDVDALLDRIAGRKIIASISGGKDSAAMSLYLTELGLEHDRVFMDTGWENAVTYEYIRGELPAVIGPITELRAPETMVELIRRKAMFPSRQRRFCTEELKVKPLQAYIAGLVDDGEDVINAVGIRAGESDARAKMPEWEWSNGFDCETWRPLISWTLEDVIDIHTRHGLRPNPLYLRGASRVGCWPCIYARKAEIRMIADTDPERIDIIRALEAEITERAAEGERPGLRAWFPPRIGRAGDPWPIDDIVAWSRTSRGGKQVELFAAPPDEQGCMRWGLCETDTPDEGDDE